MWHWQKINGLFIVEIGVCLLKKQNIGLFGENDYDQDYKEIFQISHRYGEKNNKT